MYELSRSVVPGDLVSLRGEKFIRCGGRARPEGVYVAAATRRIILLSGEKVTHKSPEGVICYGPTTINVAKGVEEDSATSITG